jgi:hypothetical protein
LLRDTEGPGNDHGSEGRRSVLQGKDAAEVIVITFLPIHWMPLALLQLTPKIRKAGYMQSLFV